MTRSCATSACSGASTRSASRYDGARTASLVARVCAHAFVVVQVTQDQSGEARYSVIGCSPASVADLQSAEAAKYNKQQRA